MFRCFDQRIYKVHGGLEATVCFEAEHCEHVQLLIHVLLIARSFNSYKLICLLALG